MRRYGPILVFLVGLTLAGCGSGVTAPGIPADGGSPPPGPPPGDPPATPAPPATLGEPRVLAILPSVVTLSPGDEEVLEFRFLDHGGRIVPVDRGPEWSTDAPGRATIDPDGVVRAGEALGVAWVHARRDAMRDSVAVVVQRRQGEPSDFRITLHYADGVPGWWRPALEAAAARWERVIRGRLPAVEVSGVPNVCGFLSTPPPGMLSGEENGVRLFIQVSDGFPEGTYVEAVGGPCAHRGLPEPTTVLGAITLNTDKFAAGIPPDRLRYLAHHEMGHTLGLVGGVQGHQPPWLDAGAGTYRGLLGLHGRSLDTRVTVHELDYGDGGHWPFADLMGVFIDPTIGRATVGALMDLGYPAAWYGAGPLD